MDKVVQHLLCFEGEGKVRDFPGNYTLYRAWQGAREEEEAKHKEKKTIIPSEPKRPSSTRAPKLTYAEKKELEGLEGRITALEEEKLALEATLSAGTLTHAELITASERIGVLINELDELVLRQLELEEKTG